MKLKVSIIVPAYNESKDIGDTLEALKAIPEIDEIIVVDDASQDDTVKLARQTGVTVISLPHNMGKGGALNKGLENVTGEIIGLVDADLGKTASDVRKLILPVLAGKADMTIAKFPRAMKKGGFGLVKGLARVGIKHFTGLEMDSPLSGQRVLIKDIVNDIGYLASGYGVEVGLTIDVARKGYKVIEVEVNMTHAETGRDLKGFMHRGKQFLHVSKVLMTKLVSR